MTLGDLLDKIGDQPVFSSSMLLAGMADVGNLRRQLCRWLASGRLIQLRRGVYVLAERYRKVQPHPFMLANALKKASYVSLQSALAEYGMIPEHVPVVTSVTTGRPEEVKTPLGTFLYKHVKKAWFHGYQARDLGNGQTAFVATPEMALLDLLYLTPGGETGAFLRELRLQNLEKLDPDKLRAQAAGSGRPKLKRAVEQVLKLRSGETMEEL